MVAALPPNATLAGGAWAALVFGVIGLLVWRVPWEKLHQAWEAVPALAFFGVVALLRDANGGLESGIAPLVLLPVVWLALYHDRWLILLGLILVEAVLLAPLTLIGAPHYPASEWRRAVLMGALAAAIGFTTHWLVARLRTQIVDLAAAEARARAEAQFSGAILDGTAMLIMVYDLAGRLALVNRAWEKTSGYRTGEVLGRRPWDLISDEAEAAACADHFTIAVHELGAPSVQQVRHEVLHTRGGQRRIIAWRHAALRDERGDLTHLIATGIDITDQQNTETLLSRVLHAATEQAMIGTDLDGVINVFNAGAQRLLGYPAHEVIGRLSPNVFYLPGEVAAVLSELGADPESEVFAAVAGVERATTREWTYVRADGSRVAVAVTVSEIHNDAGVMIGYLGTARDITAERAAAEALRSAYEHQRATAQRLRELDQARTQFLAAASHDLRTPLTGVISFLDLLAEHDHDPAERQLVDGAQRNAQRLFALVTNLLTISQIDAGTLHLNRQPTPLGDVVHNAVRAFDAAVASYELDVRVELPEPPPIVDADPGKLHRALTNLLDNAVKFTPDGGQVTITAAQASDAIELQVSDTGIGIPSTELPHVFDRFYRSSRTQQVITGTGVGLAITKGIVEAHGGQISATSDPGRGTTITFTVPANHQASRPDGSPP